MRGGCSSTLTSHRWHPRRPSAGRSEKGSHLSGALSRTSRLGCFSSSPSPRCTRRRAPAPYAPSSSSLPDASPRSPPEQGCSQSSTREPRFFASPGPGTWCRSPYPKSRSSLAAVCSRPQRSWAGCTRSASGRPSGRAAARHPRPPPDGCSAATGTGGGGRPLRCPAWWASLSPCIPSRQQPRPRSAPQTSAPRAPCSPRDHAGVGLQIQSKPHLNLAGTFGGLQPTKGRAKAGCLVSTSRSRPHGKVRGWSGGERLAAVWRQGPRSAGNNVSFPPPSPHRLVLQGGEGMVRSAENAAGVPRAPAQRSARGRSPKPGLRGRSRSPSAIHHLRAPAALLSKGIKGHDELLTSPVKRGTDEPWGCSCHSPRPATEAKETVPPNPPHGRLQGHGATRVPPPTEAGPRRCWRRLCPPPWQCFRAGMGLVRSLLGLSSPPGCRGSSKHEGWGQATGVSCWQRWLTADYTYPKASKGGGHPVPQDKSCAGELPSFLQFGEGGAQAAGRQQELGVSKQEGEKGVFFLGALGSMKQRKTLMWVNSGWPVSFQDLLSRSRSCSASCAPGRWKKATVLSLQPARLLLQTWRKGLG